MISFNLPYILWSDSPSHLKLELATTEQVYEMWFFKNFQNLQLEEPDHIQSCFAQVLGDIF